MADEAQHDLELLGCTPEPLMAYLKSLSILRLVSEQKDPTARGWWQNDTFWLRSTLDQDALVKFFLEEYKPTPIVAPWARGSGFFKKDNKAAVQALRDSSSDRVAAYRDVIKNVERIIKEQNVGDKPQADDKATLIRRYRRELPDNVVRWIDATMVLQQDGQRFAPLLGTGGNDGRLNFTQNFMQRVVSLGLHTHTQATSESRACLHTALFASPTQLGVARVGQFAPGRAGGPNATQGMEGSSTDNPWDFILMLEGTLILGGAAVKRLGIAEVERATFPFTVRAVAGGFSSPAAKDEVESRGELWLPLWIRPTSANELCQLFGEGRADVSGRPARDGIEFARAVVSLGVDRGITDFNRIGFLNRSGKAFLAASIGRFQVAERPNVDLLRQIDPWLDRFRRAAGDKNAPSRFASALRRIDSAIFEFCKYGSNRLFQNILIALGEAERQLALTPGKIGHSKQPPAPLAGLSAEWIEAANDKSHEFAVARSLAFIHDAAQKIGRLRSNLEPVTIWYDKNEGSERAAWAEKDRTVVWNAADLPTNLANVLQRRIMDGNRTGCEHLPLKSHYAAPLDAIARFIAGELDDNRIEQLIWGLMLIDPCRSSTNHVSEEDPMNVPRVYALLKLLFLPRPLVLRRNPADSVFARFLRSNDPKNVGTVIHTETSILHLLRATRLGEACAVAMRRLRASGLDPMPKLIRGHRIRDGDWKELDTMGAAGIDPLRLAAAILIPISDATLNKIVRLVIRGDDVENDAFETAATTATDGDL